MNKECDSLAHFKTNKSTSFSAIPIVRIDTVRGRHRGSREARNRTQRNSYWGIVHDKIVRRTRLFILFMHFNLLRITRTHRCRFVHVCHSELLVSLSLFCCLLRTRTHTHTNVKRSSLLIRVRKQRRRCLQIDFLRLCACACVRFVDRSTIAPSMQYNVHGVLVCWCALVMEHMFSRRIFLRVTFNTTAERQPSQCQSDYRLISWSFASISTIKCKSKHKSKRLKCRARESTERREEKM